MMIRSVVVSMLSPYETADLWHEAAPGPCSEIRLWLVRAHNEAAQLMGFPIMPESLKRRLDPVKFAERGID
jgi:hypothetical protein